MAREEKRMAGDYEITQAIEIGHKEIVLGVNPQDNQGKKYMCAFANYNDFFQTYDEVLVSDNYAEIMQIFGERVSKEANRIVREIANLKIPTNVITQDDCYPNNRNENINGKIVAIDSSVLRPEYQRADRQLYIVTGGFGAEANSRGNAVFCQNIYDGSKTRYERYDILGEVKPECVPQWAKDKLNGKVSEQDMKEAEELKELQKLLDDRECKEDVEETNNLENAKDKSRNDFTR